MKHSQQISELFLRDKEPTLIHRYITNSHIEPLLKNLSDDFKINQIGRSVNNLPIYGVKIGNGKIKVLMWSQMHGNESTTTKVLFDIFKSFSNTYLKPVLEELELYIIPILNPDGATSYTRHNANDIDLNRDAIDLSQPETSVLLDVFNKFQPHYCFNLHGQRTIFSAGHQNNPATVSFLAPAQDKECSVTKTRKTAMEVIVAMHKVLQDIIPGQIGIYDDSFNLNCIGDTFQSHNVPTILFEAGHFKNDYAREEVRKFIFIALITALFKITDASYVESSFEEYGDIPENQKLFYDIIFRNVRLTENGDGVDIAFQYEEQLHDNHIIFIPKIEKIEKSICQFGHREWPSDGKLILGSEKEQLYVGYEKDVIFLNNELFSLNLDKS